MQTVKCEIETAHERMTATYCPFGAGIPAEHAAGTKCRGMNCAAFDIVAVDIVEAKPGTPMSSVTVCGQQVANGAEATKPTFEVPTYGCLRMGAPVRMSRLAA